MLIFPSLGHFSLVGLFFLGEAASLVLEEELLNEEEHSPYVVVRASEVGELTDGVLQVANLLSHLVDKLLDSLYLLFVFRQESVDCYLLINLDFVPVFDHLVLCEL